MGKLGNIVSQLYFLKVDKPINIVSQLCFPKVSKPGNSVSQLCFPKMGKPGNSVSQLCSRRWTNQETLFPSHVSRRWTNYCERKSHDRKSISVPSYLFCRTPAFTSVATKMARNATTLTWTAFIFSSKHKPLSRSRISSPKLHLNMSLSNRWTGFILQN